MLRERSLNLWANWLVVVALLNVVIGLLLALTSIGSTLTVMLFGWSPAALPPVTAEGENLVRFFFGLIGGIMAGWGLALAAIAHVPFRRGERWAWITIAASIVTWFLVDSAMSAATGVYANVIGNVGFLVLFEIPLVATYGTMMRTKSAAQTVAPKQGVAA